MSHETLFAVLDGEHSPGELDRLLDEIERSPQLARQWSRWCLVREAQEGVRITREQGCICAGVISALDGQEALSDKVVPIAPSARPAAAARRWRPLISLAAAASVVGFGLVAVLNLQTPSPTGAVPVSLTQLQPASPSAEAGKVIPVTGADTRVSQTRQVWANAAVEDLQQLDDYLIDHSNLRSVAGVGGSLGYARFAAYTADYRPADSDPAGR